MSQASDPACCMIILWGFDESCPHHSPLHTASDKRPKLTVSLALMDPSQRKGQGLSHVPRVVKFPKSFPQHCALCPCPTGHGSQMPGRGEVTRLKC